MTTLSSLSSIVGAIIFLSPLNRRRGSNNNVKKHGGYNSNEPNTRNGSVKERVGTRTMGRITKRCVWNWANNKKERGREPAY